MVLASHRDMLHCLHYSYFAFTLLQHQFVESARFLELLHKCLFYDCVPDNLNFFSLFSSFSPFSIQNVAMTNSKEHVF